MDAHLIAGCRAAHRILKGRGGGGGRGKGGEEEKEDKARVGGVEEGRGRRGYGYERGGGGGQPREDNYRGMERVKATECTTKTRPGRQMKFSKVVEWAKRAVGRQGGRAAG